MNGAPTLTGVYKGQNTSGIKISGNCEGAQFLRVTYSSPLTPEKVVKINCSTGAVTSELLSTILAVNEGTKSQIFNFEFRALKSGKYTPALRITFNYNPIPDPVAGFTISAGGGIPSSGAFASIQSSTIGEVVSPTTQFGSGGEDLQTRTGFQGVIDP